MGRVSPLTDMMGVLLPIGILVLALGAIATIIYGMRMRAKRRASEVEVAERGADAGIGRAPVEQPVALDEPAAAAPVVTVEPSAADAPFDGSPAELAVESVPVADAAPLPVTDDLTTLKGLGPKVAARFGELGITRLAQLAALSPDEAEALDAQLGAFAGRMARDRWVEQAKLLAVGDRAGFEAAFGKL